MGVDIATFRSRIGCCRQNCGHDVVQFTVHVNFTYTLKWLCTLPLLLFILLLFINQSVLYDNGECDMNVRDLAKSTTILTGFHLCTARGAKNFECKCPGSVAFIGILLVMAGIEENPGPLPIEDETTKKATIPEVSHNPSTTDSQSSARSNSGYKATIPEVSKNPTTTDRQSSATSNSGYKATIPKVSQNPTTTDSQSSARSTSEFKATIPEVSQNPTKTDSQSSTRSNSEYKATIPEVSQDPTTTDSQSSTRSNSEYKATIPEVSQDPTTTDSQSSARSNSEYKATIPEVSQNPTTTDSQSSARSNSGYKATIPEVSQNPTTTDSQPFARSNSGYNDGSGDEYFDAEEEKKLDDFMKSYIDKSSDSMVPIFQEKETQIDIVPVRSTDTQTDIITPIPIQSTDSQKDIVTPVIVQTMDTQTDDDRKELKSSEVQTFSKADILEQQALRVRCKIGLTDYFHRKISLKDVMKISTRSDVPGNSNLIWKLLQDLIMVNFEARDRYPHELYKQAKGLRKSTEEKFNIDILKNHDIFITMFNCCDSSLKQVLFSKMFLCRLAVPLIYPTFQSGSFCFSLWSFRSITLDVKEKVSMFLTNYPLKVVSFIRLSRPKFSKSFLLNAVISNQQNQHHQTFYNKECLLGTHKREITNGLVEASWYIPSGQDNDVFQDMIMFTNLRGDALEYVDQMKMLTDISNCIVITIDFGDVEKYMEFLNEMQITTRSMIILATGKQIRSVSEYFEQQNLTVITLFDLDEEKNTSTLRMELQENISDSLQKSTDTCLEDWASCASKQGIAVDEWSGDHLVTKQIAVLLSKRLEYFPSIEVKKKLLPLQDIWKDISKRTKILKRITASTLPSTASEYSEAQSTLWTKEPIKNEIAKLRCDQSRLCGDSYSLANMLIDVLVSNADKQTYISSFLEWIRFYFDKRSHVVLPKLMEEYHQLWEKYTESKQHDQQHDVEIIKNEMRIAEQSLLDASIGLEHIFREIGQLYESSKESRMQHISSEQTILFNGLPDVAAKLLVLGYPLELMDGDAVNVPTVWIKSVFDSCIKLLGDKKVFVISILGVQSSGKSTFLNSLFGLQFSVSAGRCTRGIYLQMMPVDHTHGLPIDFLLVVDTEGLRAPELAFQSYDHDNELATLAVGIADMTIVNVKGENTSEVRDVLEIVIHALLRLKLANAHLHFNTSCTFVHQNVSASNAASKMQLGRQKLIELLDEVTREAALEVGMKDTQTFKQVIQFDIKKDVWYVPDLWNGDPPMAHINPGYSRKIASIKSAILQQIQSKTESFRSLSTTSVHILDLWNGILSEDFVFSFRNSNEVKVYNIMESKYRKQTWALQEFQMHWIADNADKIGEFEKDFRAMFEQEFTKLKHFFENSAHKDELIKWKGTQLIAFRNFSENLISRTKTELLQIHEQRVLQKKTKTMNECHLEEINEQAKALAKELKGKKPSEKALKRHFDDMWFKWLQTLEPVEQTDIESLETRIDNTLFCFKKQLQGTIFQEIEKSEMNRIVKDLICDAKRLPCTQDIHFTIRPFFESKQKVKNLGHRVFTHEFKEKCRAKTTLFQRELFSCVDLQIKRDVSNLNVRFQSGHLVQLLDMIDSKIEEHNNGKENEFEFLPQYRAMIMVYVSRHVLHVFTEVNERYDREYSPRAIIEKYKSTAWSFFKNLVDEKTHDIIAATFVCEAMKAKLNDTLQQHVAISIESRVRTHFSHSKCSLIVNILDNLAHQENFEMYKEYLSSPASCALQWITDYTNDRFFNKFEYIGIVSDYVNDSIEDFKDEVNEAGEKCKTKTENRMESFTSFFKTVPIPNHTMKEMCKYELNDVDNFLTEIRQMLLDLQREIIEEHTKKSPNNINWVKSPYIGIFQGLWGCTEVCPFCKEPCQNMENHVSVNKTHTCIQHRPRGVSGRHWRESKTIVIESCSFGVQSNAKTSCQSFKYGCRKHSDCKSKEEVSHPYKNYKTYLPDWDIAPSSDMESSKYWMWFMAKFSKELAEWYAVEPPDIPDSWKSISKEEALNSLRLCYGY